MSNYVNREDLYEILQSMPSICVSDKYVFVGKDMYVRNDSIELPWINIRDRVPQNDSEVIVSVYDDSGDSAWEYTCVAWYYNNMWIRNNELINSYDIIAWMPLPSPYEVKHAAD